MKLPKIATDDALLFGSLFVFALGAVLTVAAATGNLILAFGAGLIVFGLPSTLIAFLASAQPEE
jgi:hypothetical protein